MTRVLSIILILFSMITGVFGQNDCDQPEIISVSGAGSYCLGEEVTLTVNGNLNDASEWTWYANRCGGQAIGAGESITVTVEESTEYFVRGTGNCVGNTASCTSLEVKLDDIAPNVLQCQSDIIVNNEPGTCQAIVTYEVPTGEDNCSSEILVELKEGLESGSIFPVGITLVTYTLSDDQGNISTCSFNVIVEDSEVPIISCIEDIEVDNDPGDCGAIVTYDLPVGVDNCPGAVTTLTEGLGSGAFFPVGTTIETYTVTDASGNATSCSFAVTVYDIEPPVISVSDKRKFLWPPNHKHHDIEIADFIIEVSDNCGGVSIEDVVIEKIESDEPNNGLGDGNTMDDIIISDECKSASLLAERMGGGNGRVYTVGLALKDTHGNIGTANFNLEVPHDMSKKKDIIQDEVTYTVNGCDLRDNESETSTKTSSRVQVEVNAYPNPFANSFEIRFSPVSNDRINVELFSMTGKRVGTLITEDVKANTEYRWSFSPELKMDDVYILVIWGEKNYGMRRIIKK